MLRQEINLYRSFLPTPTSSSPLTWKRLWLINGIFVLLFFLVYFASLWEVSYLRKEKANLDAEIKQLQDKFLVMKSAYPAFFFSDDLGESMKKLEANIALQETILGSLKNKIPFSQEMLAFSRAIVPSVWLTEITLLNNGEAITLKGQSLSRNSLQTFITNLLNDKLFTGFHLHVNNIESTNKTPGNENLTFEFNVAKKPYESLS